MARNRLHFHGNPVQSHTPRHTHTEGRALANTSQSCYLFSALCCPSWGDFTLKLLSQIYWVISQLPKRWWTVVWETQSSISLNKMGPDRWGSLMPPCISTCLSWFGSTVLPHVWTGWLPKTAVLSLPVSDFRVSTLHLCTVARFAYPTFTISISVSLLFLAHCTFSLVICSVWNEIPDILDILFLMTWLKVYFLQNRILLP
jgi:hypothetical protein